MQNSRVLETPLKHPGSERSAAVLRVDDFWAATPVSITQGKYVLVVASERTACFSSTEVARAWIDAGASYVCAWGRTSGETEEAFDYSAFLPELGAPLSFTLMTTSHREEPLEEALWFAFYNATAPDDLQHDLASVVIVVESAALEQKCISWVLENTE